MRVFVRKQPGECEELRFVDQAALRGAIVARFVMLKTEVSDVVAERQQKVIVAIMARTEKGACFSNKLVQVYLGFGCHRQRRFAVRRDVDIVRRILSRGQLDSAVIAACEYRR